MKKYNINLRGVAVLGKKTTANYNLYTESPSISAQFNLDRNKPYKPTNIFPHSNKNYWWECENGHEWKTSPNHRLSGTGCPMCKKRYMSSFEELSIIFYLKKTFNSTQLHFPVDFKSKYKDVDVFIPELNLVVEYDGYHHKDRYEEDFEKTNVLLSMGFEVIRIRNSKLKLLNMENVIEVHHIEGRFKSLDNALNELMGIIDRTNSNKIHINYCSDINTKRDRFKILEQLPAIIKKNNVSDLLPELISEWHSTKNHDFLPSHFSVGTHFPLWWKCSEGHEWEATPHTRKKGHGCPTCAGKVATFETSLLFFFPEIAKEWNYEKNSLLPSDFLPSSNLLVWWKCVNGHSWKTSPEKRTRDKPTGCPYCINKKVNINNCLATTHPYLAEQWHPVNNDNLTPYDVTAGSDKKVWWVCQDGHEWEARLYSRKSGRGCKECYQNSRMKQ